MSDLISREQTHELLSERMRDTALYNACEDAGTILIDIVQNRLEKWLNELPSAQPTHTTHSNTLDALDCISRQAAIDKITKYCMKYDLRDLLAEIEVLPSAEPEQKTGKWNLEFVPSTMNFYLHRCSECEGTAEEAMKFCCHCGARMVEEEQDG